MVSSGKKRSTSKTVRSTSKTTKPSTTGHVYEFLGWKGDKGYLNANGGFKITVSLKDLTNGEQITRRGKVKPITNYSVTTIDNLEGHKDVYLRLHFNGDKGKVENTPGVGWTLSLV